MTNISKTFTDQGFIILEGVLNESELRSIDKNVNAIGITKAGSRNLLSATWCQDVVGKLRSQTNIQELISDQMVAVQCTYFEKTESKNWLVSLHRDYFIPLKEKLRSPNWQNWTLKEGIHFCRPPNDVLSKLIAIRVHLEENDDENGPLKVVPGSHINEEVSCNTVNCYVPEGGALVFHPLLLHASSKVKKGNRRVLHFLFGPKYLPDNAIWANAV